MELPNKRLLLLLLVGVYSIARAAQKAMKDFRYLLVLM